MIMSRVSWLRLAGSLIGLFCNYLPAATLEPNARNPLLFELKQQITSSDGATDDQFGWSIAAESGVALVGAPNTTVGGKSGQGVVYVFTETNGTWVQTQVLTAINGQSGDAFGISVSVASPWAFIGAPNTDNFRGAVYVFRRSGRTWIEGQALIGSDATTFNQFGWSIAQDGRRALIGSINATVGTNSSQGAVYFFKNDSGLWSESQKFSSSDGVSGDSFGWAVALDHDDALVGAGFATVDDHEFQGAAYTFHRDGDLWTETQKLTADNGEAFDFFGLAVALGRNQALVGAEGASTDGNPFSNQGVVYVYSHEDQSWNPLQTLAASDGEPSDGFGHSISSQGGRALVGAPGVTVNGAAAAGAIYTFDQVNRLLKETGKLTPNDAVENGQYGWSVSLLKASVFAGAYSATAGGHERQGAAYIYIKKQ